MGTEALISGDRLTHTLVEQMVGRSAFMSELSNHEKAILSNAVTLNSRERAAYLKRMCAEDPDSLDRMQQWIHRQDHAGELLENPMAGIREIMESERADDQIDRYYLIGKLGEGGCGVVYLAEQQEPVRRKVALKIIKLGMDTKEVVARFEVERQALAAMEHPNIACVFDAGTTKTGRPYFIMELVAGVRITDYCDKARLSLEARLHLFIQVCQAIEHAHQKGIIHRDIKPSNVLVALQNGVEKLKVIDFGIAKATRGRLAERTVFTALDQLIGTPAYMSPEQASRGEWDVDTRSDLYSLGVLLYELLTGCTPIDPREISGLTVSEICRRILEDEPRRPAAQLKGLDGKVLSEIAVKRRSAPARLIKFVESDLAWIVMRCLEKDRRRRYESANGLVADLKRFLKREPVEARPPSFGYLFKRFAQRHRTGLIALTVILGIFVAATSLSVWQTVRISRAEKRARLEASTSSAVAAFLRKDLLLQASPDHEPDREIKLRTLVDRAAEKVDGAFVDQPLVEAQIRETLAATYDSLGEYGATLSHLQRALALRERWSGSDDPSTLRTAGSMVDAFNKVGKFPEADALGQKTIALQVRKLGPEHAETLSTKANLASTFGGEGKFKESEQLFLTVFEAQKRILGPTHHATLDTANALGRSYHARGQLSAAEALYRPTLATLQQVLGKEHPTTLNTMGYLSSVLLDENRFAEAETLAKETLDLRRRALGENHPSTLSSMIELGSIYTRDGKASEAEALLKQVIEVAQKSLGLDHPKTLNAMGHLVRVYDLEGKYDDAVTLGLQTMELEKQALGPDHPNRLIGMSNLSLIYRKQGKLDRAEALQIETLESEKRVLGLNHPATLAAMRGLAMLQVQEGKFAAAEPVLRTVLEVYAKSAPDDWRRFSTISLLAEDLVGQNRSAEAEPLFLEGYEGLKSRAEQIPKENRSAIIRAGERIQHYYTESKQPEKVAAWNKELASERAALGLK